MKNIYVFVSLAIILQFNAYPQQAGWNVVKLDITENLNSIYFTNNGVGYACGNFGTIINSLDSGKSWQTVPNPASVKLNDVFIFDTDNVLCVGNSGTIIRSSDGGINWETINSGVTDDLLSVSFIDSLGICGARSQTILYSSNSGISWEIAQSGYMGGGFWGASMISPQIGFVAGENTIFKPLVGKTTDSGQTWDFVAFYLNNNEGRATGVDFTDEFVGFVSSRVWDGRGAISKTTDEGSNWQTTFFNNSLWGIDFPISNTGQIGYAVGDIGRILKTYDAGENWHEQVSSTSEKLNKVYFLDVDNGFVAGDNGLILKTTNGGESVTGAYNNNSTAFSFILSQNYPNPFNPSTSIQYAISSSQFVSLKVYDVLGNEVSTLVNEEKPTGEYEIEFNAENLPSGIYFYRLNAGRYSSTKKMILLR